MSTTDPNNDNQNPNEQFNFLNGEQESDSEEFVTPVDSELPTTSTDSDLEDDSSDSSDIVQEELYTNSTDESMEDSSDSSDAYAPLEGEQDYTEGDSENSEEPTDEEERKEVYHPPVMNRYNTILLITFIMLTIGVILLLFRLADYKFNVKAKQTDDGFGMIEYVIPQDVDSICVTREA